MLSVKAHQVRAAAIDNDRLVCGVADRRRGGDLGGRARAQRVSACNGAGSINCSGAGRLRWRVERRRCLAC